MTNTKRHLVYSRKRQIDISLVLPPEPDERWQLAKQAGVNHAVFHSLEIGEGSRPYEYEELLRIVNTYRDHDIGRGIFSAQITVNRAASMRNGYLRCRITTEDRRRRGR
jgi:hypothetical protein